MLSVLIVRDSIFTSIPAALDYLSEQEVQRITVPIRDLSINEHGRLSHTGRLAIEQLQDLPLTDVSLDHLNNLMGMPKSYAARIDPSLHAHSLNNLLTGHIAPVTIMTTMQRNKPASKHITAIVPGARFGIDDSSILSRLVHHGLSGSVTLRSGQMEVEYGDPTVVEVLPKDQVQFTGKLYNEHWLTGKTNQWPSLEASVFWKRLICTNGAYLMRQLAKKEIVVWASQREVNQFIDIQIDRVLNFHSQIIRNAVACMSDALPDNNDYHRYHQLIARHAGESEAEKYMAEALSWWDLFNAVTAAARPLGIVRQRTLQLAGGEILERFINK